MVWLDIFQLISVRHPNIWSLHDQFFRCLATDHSGSCMIQNIFSIYFLRFRGSVWQCICFCFALMKNILGISLALDSMFGGRNKIGVCVQSLGDFLITSQMHGTPSGLEIPFILTWPQIYTEPRFWTDSWWLCLVLGLLQANKYHWWVR